MRWSVLTMHVSAEHCGGLGEDHNGGGVTEDVLVGPAGL